MLVMEIPWAGGIWAEEMDAAARIATAARDTNLVCNMAGGAPMCGVEDEGRGLVARCRYDGKYMATDCAG